jgi:uncharacterized membrane protein YphA (DoxX/SURF4 family)
MTLTHALARSTIAPIFIGGGVDSVRNPEPKAKAAESTARRLGEYGLPSDPTKLVRFNGGVQLVAGSLLVLGRLPRLASAALAVSLVPTTLAGHRFWEETDPVAKAHQRVQLLKNLAILGGLILAATDTNGAPSLTWRAKRATRRASDSVASLSSSVGSHLAHHPSLSDRVGTLGDRAMDAAGPFIDRARAVAENVGEQLSDRASAARHLL